MSSKDNTSLWNSGIFPTGPKTFWGVNLNLLSLRLLRVPKRYMYKIKLHSTLNRLRLLFLLCVSYIYVRYIYKSNFTWKHWQICDFCSLVPFLLELFGQFSIVWAHVCLFCHVDETGRQSQLNEELNLAVRPRAAVELCDYSLQTHHSWHTVIWYTIIVKIKYWLHLIYDCLLKIRTMVAEENRDFSLSFILSSEVSVFGFVSPVDQKDGHKQTPQYLMTPKLSRQVLLCSSQWVRRHREHYCVSSQIPLCCISIQLNTSLCRGHGERIMFELIRLNQTRTGCVLPHCLWRHDGSSKIPQFVCSLFFSIFNNLFKFYLPSKTVMFFFLFFFFSHSSASVLWPRSTSQPSRVSPSTRKVFLLRSSSLLQLCGCMNLRRWWFYGGRSPLLNDSRPAFFRRGR